MKARQGSEKQAMGKRKKKKTKKNPAGRRQRMTPKHRQWGRRRAQERDDDKQSAPAIAPAVQSRE